ncbi:MAG: hypothetical protein LUH82_04310 [Clostridiales bacterium]|nr:hypothetical protein [Clostridiales bacterium]
MTSTNLRNNKFKEILQVLLKRHWFSIFFCAAASLVLNLALIGDYLSGYPISELAKDSTVVYPASETQHLWRMLICIAVLIMGVMSFTLQHQLYREAYSKRASDWLFSLPVKRETYYNAAALINVIAIAVYYIIGVIVYSAVFSSPLSAWAKYFETDMSEVLLLAGFGFLISVGMALVCSLAAVLSGKAWHYVAMCFIVFGLWPAAGGCVIELVNTIWGVYISSVAGEINVPSVIMLLCFGTESVSGAILWAFLIVETVLAYVLGLLAFKKRKSEIAEMAVSGKAAVAFAGFITALYAFLQIYLAVSDTAIGIVLGILGALIAGIICVCVLTFTTKRFLKLGAVSAAAAALVSLAFVLAVMYVPNISYKNYVPAAADVESVRVQEDDYGYSTSSLDAIYYYIYGVNETSFYFDQVLTGDEAKACVETLHKAVLEPETEAASKKLAAAMNSYDYDWYDSMQWLTIEYALTDGSVISRSYYVDAGYVYEQLAALLQSEECVKNMFPSTIDEDRILFLCYDSYLDEDSDYTTTDFVTFSDYTPFIEAIEKERQESDVTAFLAQNTDIYPSEHFFDTYYDNVTTYSIGVYYIANGATDEQIAKLKSMTPAEIYNSYYYVDEDGNSSDLPITWESVMVSADAGADIMEYIIKQGTTSGSVYTY